jgi:hypothetical protein
VKTFNGAAWGRRLDSRSSTESILSGAVVRDFSLFTLPNAANSSVFTVLHSAEPHDAVRSFLCDALFVVMMKPK